MAPQNGEPSTPPVDLRILQTKLTAWKKWEKDNGRPMAFSRAEETALRLLTMSDSEPNLDDSNYISRLHEAIQKQKLNTPPLVPIEENLIDHSTKQSRFRVYYTLPNGLGNFPREGFGYNPGEEAPSFSQKKRAKQFAAKWALAGLEAGDDDDGSNSAPDHDSDSDGSSYYYEAGDGDSDDDEDDDDAFDDDGEDDNESNRRVNHPPPSMQHSPERKKLKVEDAEVQNGAPTRPPPGLKKHSTSLPSDVGIFKQVEILCKRLGFDIPRYTIKSTTNGTWSGRPILWSDGLMPDTLGHVQDVQSKFEAKVLMAGEILVWLKSEEQKRESQYALGTGFSKLMT